MTASEKNGCSPAVAAPVDHNAQRVSQSGQPTMATKMRADAGNIDIADILRMNGSYTVREFLDQRLSSPTLTTRILERVVGPLPENVEQPFSATRGLMDDLNAARAEKRALETNLREHMKAARLFITDCIDNGHDRAPLANLYGARDEIDAALAKTETGN